MTTIPTLTIGRVADAAGCSVQTVRYYEQIGLIAPPARSAGNQRVYDESAADRLRFVRHARELGFPLESIRDLLSLSDRPDQSCAAADAIARAQLSAVEARLTRLTALKRELERMVAQCRGGAISDCRVIQVLGDHGLCQAADHAAPQAEADAGAGSEADAEADAGAGPGSGRGFDRGADQGADRGTDRPPAATEIR